VGDAAAVAEVDGADELLEVFPGDVFLHLSLGHLGEEFSSLDVLDHHENLGFVGHNLSELHDVGVTHQAHDGDLAFDLLHQLILLEPLFLDDLDGHALVGAEVSPVVDLGEVSLPQHLPYLVLVEQDVPAATRARSRAIGSAIHLGGGDC